MAKKSTTPAKATKPAGKEIKLYSKSKDQYHVTTLEEYEAAKKRVKDQGVTNWDWEIAK